MEFNSCVCRIKIYFSLNSQENEKIEFFCQETYVFQILGSQTIFAAYEDLKRSQSEKNQNYNLFHVWEILILSRLHLSDLNVP